jgi:hypothetical protein
MYFDRFDVVAAHYAFCADYYNGMGCDLYRRLCRISRYYQPGAAYRGYTSLSENAQCIYDALVAKHDGCTAREGRTESFYANR